jgi:hypothetical protein
MQKLFPLRTIYILLTILATATLVLWFLNPTMPIGDKNLYALFYLDYALLIFFGILILPKKINMGIRILFFLLAALTPLVDIFWLSKEVNVGMTEIFFDDVYRSYQYLAFGGEWQHYIIWCLIVPIGTLFLNRFAFSIEQYKRMSEEKLA